MQNNTLQVSDLLTESDVYTFSGFSPQHRSNHGQAVPTFPTHALTIQDIFQYIVDPKLKPRTDMIRNAKSEAERSELKKTCLLVTFGGTFTHRDKLGLIGRSQYLCLDIDLSRNPETIGTPDSWSRVWNAVNSDIVPALMFRTVSGGMKIIPAVDPKLDYSELHRAFESMFKQRYGVTVDSSCKDVSRGHWIYHDPNAILNENPLLYGRNLLNIYGQNATATSEIKIQNAHRIGDIYSADPAAIDDTRTLLTKAGWKSYNGIHWTRPGKEHGVSATLAKVAPNIFYVFSSSANPFDPGKGYTPFQVLALLKYSGDFTKAAKYLKPRYKSQDNPVRINGSSVDSVKAPAPEATSDEIPFIRVGPDYYKLITVRDPHYGFSEIQLMPWKKCEIRQDHGNDIFDRIPKYDDFTIVPDNRKFSRVHGNCYNRYSEFRHKPVAGDWSWSKKMMEHIFGDQYHLGMRYMQALYLRPDHILPILCLVSRERETGKTSFLNWINMIYGNNVANITPNDLLSDFSESYADKNIILIEETTFEKKQTTEKIKALSTAKFITLNQKFVNRKSLPFFGKIILTSNNEKAFIKIDFEEIRFFVRKVGRPHEYAHDIERHLKKEIPAFLHHLTTLPEIDWTTDRSGFTPDELSNGSLSALKEESRTGLYKMLRSRVEEYFLNNRIEQFFADARSIKHEWFLYNHDITEKYIHDTLQNEFMMMPSDPIRRYPFGGHESRVARFYTFSRNLWVSDNNIADNEENLSF